METMNYNRDNKKNKKTGVISFALFACIGTIGVAYMISHEPKPAVIGQDLYIPVDTQNVDIYSEQPVKEINVQDIKYTVKNNISAYTKGNFKSNISVPVITVDGEELTEVNKTILDKFAERYEAVKKEATGLENKFLYKVTYNKYESTIDNTRILSFTFYERIVDSETGEDTTYKLYAFNIDLATKKIITQADVAPVILGSTYKTIIKDKVKTFVINQKIFTETNYTYVLTGLEEFYVKDEKLHIMFNPGELGKNKDYIDITIN